MDDILIRHGEPTKLDHAAPGTLCKVGTVLTDKYDLYIQQSTNESDPQWVLLGSFDQSTDKNEMNHIINNARGHKL